MSAPEPAPGGNETRVGLRAVESNWDLDVVDDAEHSRWIATLGADAVAELTYRLVGGRVVLLHTWVDPAYRGHRVATELAARVLPEIRKSGKKITVICPVVGEVIGRNPEYLDLIDEVHPGAGAYPLLRTTDGDRAQELGASRPDRT